MQWGFLGNTHQTFGYIRLVILYLKCNMIIPYLFWPKIKSHDDTIVFIFAETHIGNCLTSDRSGRYFCYVQATSGCPDKRSSSRSNGLFFSYQACDDEAVAPAADFNFRTWRILSVPVCLKASYFIIKVPDSVASFLIHYYPM